MRRLRLALLAMVASCAPDFRGASRMLASDVAAPREPLLERRATYRDSANSQVRREWHVLILADGSTVLHGLDTGFHAGGEIEYEREYDHGEPTGHWRWWWPAGHLRMEATYGTNQPEPMRWWHENGELSSEGLAREGLKEGRWTFFHENGTKSADGRFVAGKREGEWNEWGPDGELLECATYGADVKVERN